MSANCDTLKVCEFRPRSSSEGPALTRDSDSQLLITEHFSKVSMEDTTSEEDIKKNNNNNNFLKCPTVKKLTTSRSNPQLSAAQKMDLRNDRPLVTRGTVLKLMDIPPPDYDQIRRSLSPCRLSPEVQSLVDNF